MLVLTTIYLADVADPAEDKAHDDGLELTRSTERSHELVRELLCLYEGKNRVLPMDLDR